MRLRLRFRRTGFAVFRTSVPVQSLVPEHLRASDADPLFVTLTTLPAIRASEAEGCSPAPPDPVPGAGEPCAAPEPVTSLGPVGPDGPVGPIAQGGGSGGASGGCTHRYGLGIVMWETGSPVYA